MTRRCRRNGRKLAKEAANLTDIATAIALESRDQPESDLLYWSRAIQAAIAEHREDLASSAADLAGRRARLVALEDAFRAMAMAMEFGFLFDSQRQLLSIGYSIADSALDLQLLRSLGVGGASRQFLCDRQGRRAGPTLVQARPRGDAGIPRRSADFLVWLDV